MVMRFAIPSGAAEPALTTPAKGIAFSPDGSRLAYIAGPRAEIHVRALDQFEPRPLPGTADASFLSFSPDGQWIAYDTGIRTTGVAHLWKVAAAGGAPMALAEIHSFRAPPGLTWEDDRTILFASDGVLYRIRAAGGQSEVVAKPDSAKQEGDYSVPQMLPGGRWLLVTFGTKTIGIDLQTGTKKTLLDHTYAQFAPALPGSCSGILFTTRPRRGALWPSPSTGTLWKSKAPQ
jgi:sugar lactone lactonase YvrE